MPLLIPFTEAHEETIVATARAALRLREARKDLDTRIANSQRLLREARSAIKLADRLILSCSQIVLSCSQRPRRPAKAQQ